MAQLSPALLQATPVQVARGEGVYLYDTDGRRHLDFTAGIGVTSTGHCHPKTVAFALRELDRLLITAAPAADVAAFIIEPVLGEGGYVPTPAAFLEGLRERADAHGILLIADEVQTGFGRTGKFWGHQHSSVTP